MSTTATFDQSMWAETKRHRPETLEHLHNWVEGVLGVYMPTQAICEGHSAPFDILAELQLIRPDLLLVCGPRGGGKTHLSAIDSHLTARFNPRIGSTNILGGSYQQSIQIRKALKKAVIDTREDADSIVDFLNNAVRYRNGSELSFLTASAKSTRGPHYPSLKLDEVDEIDADLRESAMGIAQGEGGMRASVLMTSTYHKVAGPMAELMKRADDGEFKRHTFCVFEVLERCPESRSGPWVGGRDGYVGCPECKIKKWCHADRERNGGLPKAKRSSGHYPIDTLIQKTKGVSDRVFKSDYLCQGPSVAGLFFPAYDDTDGGVHVKESAEYDPRFPVHLSIDPGAHAGGVFFQVKNRALMGWQAGTTVNIFADQYSEFVPARTVGAELVKIAGERCNNLVPPAYYDPSGDARNAIGVTAMAEYRAGGIRQMIPWSKPKGFVAESLALVEALLGSASGDVALTIHPRCKHLRAALANFRRKKVAGQWTDDPEDPQHPFEDLIEALRGGLSVLFPMGRTDMKKSGYRTAHISKFTMG